MMLRTVRRLNLSPKLIFGTQDENLYFSNHTNITNSLLKQR